MICPYCNNEAEFVDNAEIYGKRYGQSYMMWICKPCDARVGCHKNQQARPLGTLANKELRQWRTEAHKAIDPLWKMGIYTRREIYQSLNKVFCKETHIGESDIETCKKIIEIYKPK